MVPVGALALGFVIGWYVRIYYLDVYWVRKIRKLKGLVERRTG